MRDDIWAAKFVENKKEGQPLKVKGGKEATTTVKTTYEQELQEHKTCGNES